MQNQTITITKLEAKTSAKSVPVFGLSELLERKEDLFSTTIDLTPKSIQAMVDKKIIDDLLRFRTCCTDTIASR